MKHSYMKIIYVCIYICIDDAQFEILSVTSRLDNKKGDSTVFGEKRGSLGGNSKGEPYSFEDRT